MSTKMNVLDKIYEKFKDLRTEGTSDCKFNRGDIDSGFDNTNKLMKWINKKSDWNRVLREFEMQRKESYRKSFEFYQVEYHLKLSTKDEYQLFIESDTNYVEIFNTCQVVKEIIQYIDDVISTLKGRAFEVKQAIEWERFKNGLS